MTDRNELLAHAELLQRVTPPAPDTARLVVECGASHVRDLLRSEAAPENVQDEIGHATVSLEAEAEALRAGDYRLLTSVDEDWPSIQFDDLGDTAAGAPFALWVRGDASLRRLLERAVVITGAPSSQPEAKRPTAELAGRLAAVGITIISGGAYGIEDFALRGALDEWGPSIVVTAGGLASLEPAGHRELFESVVASGGLLLSESPLSKQATQRRRAARTRIVAALGAVTIVVQGRADGHRFATHRFAETLDRLAIAPTANGPRRTLFDERSVDEVVEIVLAALGDVERRAD